MLQRKIEQSLLDWKKAATGNTKSAKTILKNLDKYHVTKAIKSATTTSAKWAEY